MKRISEVEIIKPTVQGYDSNGPVEQPQVSTYLEIQDKKCLECGYEALTHADLDEHNLVEHDEEANSLVNCLTCKKLVKVRLMYQHSMDHPGCADLYKADLKKKEEDYEARIKEAEEKYYKEHADILANPNPSITWTRTYRADQASQEDSDNVNIVEEDSVEGGYEKGGESDNVSIVEEGSDEGGYSGNVSIVGDADTDDSRGE